MKRKLTFASLWFLLTQYLLLGSWYFGNMSRGGDLNGIFWTVQAISLGGSVLIFANMKKD